LTVQERLSALLPDVRRAESGQRRHLCTRITVSFPLADGA
jgi:hypothetical protein